MIESVKESTPRLSDCLVGTTWFACLASLLTAGICSVTVVTRNVSLLSWLITGVEPNSVYAVQMGGGGLGGAVEHVTDVNSC